MGMANHAAAPMSPIPDKPISSAGTFSTVDLAMHHQQGQVSQSSGVPLGTSMAKEGVDGQDHAAQQQQSEGLKGVLQPGGMQGLHTDEAPAFNQQQHTEEDQQVAVGDLSASSASSNTSAGTGTGDDTSSDPRAEPLSLTSTISRGEYHQCGTARRVKVYELQNENWFDHGTGYCAGVYDEKHDQALLVAKAEEYCQYLNIVPPGEAGGGVVEGADTSADGDAADSQNGVIAGEAKQMKVSPSDDKGSAEDEVSQDLSNQYIIVVSEEIQAKEVLLCTKVSRDDIYQRQQDTLIVWTEPGGKDMALSFQEGDGCNEIWEFLAEVQKHFRNTASEAESSSAGGDLSRQLGLEDSFQTGDGLLSIMEGDSMLPEPTLGNIEQIDAAVRELAQRTPQFRERFAEWLLKTSYIKLLIELFSDAEDLELLEVLHHLCSVMQNILLLNDNVMFESILQDDVFMGIVGILEYDPAFPRDKASYRKYLSDPARFRQVVTIQDASILTKIHHTYRLHYLKDVVLARILEDATFSILQSIIFFYQVEIVNYCGGNEQFLSSLFSIFREDKVNGSDDEGKQRKRDGVLFLQQLCTMGKTIQLPSRITLYHTLVEWGLLDVIEFAFLEGESGLRNAAAEMLMLIIEYDANSVRLHILSEKEKKIKSLMSTLIELLHHDGDMGLKSQVVEVLRILLDCSDSSANIANQAMVQQQFLGSKITPKADPEQFLTIFYEEDATFLLSPMRKLPDVASLPKLSKLPPMTLSESALYGHLCDLLCFINTCHAFRSQYFVITSEVSKKVAALLRSRDKHVRCAAVRFFRSCLANNNQFTNRHHIKMDLFDVLLDIVEEEADKDNLVASACMNYFDYMRKENMKPLINDIVAKYRPRLVRLAAHKTAGKTFEDLLQKSDRGSAASHQGNLSVDSKSSVQSAEEHQRMMRDLDRRGANRAITDMAEENYFNEDDEDLGSAKSTANPASSHPAKPFAAGLVPYSDDDFELEFESIPMKGMATPDNLKRKSPTTSEAPLLYLGQKRRKQDDDDDEDVLDLLSAKRPDRHSSGAPPGSAAFEDMEGGFVREEDDTTESTKDPSKALGGAKKISLNLTPSTATQVAKESQVPQDQGS